MTKQELYDAMHALIMAASHAHETVTADFPDVRSQIHALVEEGEYQADPFTVLHNAIEEAVKARDSLLH